MMDELHDTCIELFTIVGHSPEEAEANYQQLMGTSTQLAISELISTLPEETQNKLTEQLPQTQTIEEAFPLFSQHFTPEQVTQALNQAFSQMMELYFGQINETLSPEQHQKISKLLLSSLSE